MHKLLVLYPDPAARAAFEDSYANKHLPLAARLPGLKASRYSFGVAGTASPYFAVFEADFDSHADMVAAMTSPEGRAVEADVPNYAPQGAVVVDYPVQPLIG
ncbi:EthD family reductase [Arthrobacter deserti]|uniref:EthD family reductase n=1 Tax=Arthrobacter deserti TaxID=1742687 RepID=A0ABX1JT51_9MICC|nr:EthD family reductase [Arthrobacter deserti]